MLRSLILAAPLVLAFPSLAQPAHQRFRAPIWTFHQSNTHTYGITVGVLSNEEWQDNVTTSGIRLEAPGVGFFLLLAPYIALPEDSLRYGLERDRAVSERVHGLNLSPLGTACDCELIGVNVSGGGTYVQRAHGLSAALFINAAVTHAGLQVALGNLTYRSSGLQLGAINSARDMHGVQFGLQNDAGRARGLQWGLFNRATDLKGLQIGFWNVNQRRKLPLFNWA